VRCGTLQRRPPRGPCPGLRGRRGRATRGADRPRPQCGLMRQVTQRLRVTKRGVRTGFQTRVWGWGGCGVGGAGRRGCGGWCGTWRGAGGASGDSGLHQVGCGQRRGRKYRDESARVIILFHMSEEGAVRLAAVGQGPSFFHDEECHGGGAMQQPVRMDGVLRPSFLWVVSGGGGWAVASDQVVHHFSNVYWMELSHPELLN